MRKRSNLRPLGIRAQEKLLSILREVIDHANLEHADFGSFWIQQKDLELPLPKTDKEVTAFIKQRVKTHHQSWIIRPLNNAIKEIEANGVSGYD